MFFFFKGVRILPEIDWYQYASLGPTYIVLCREYLLHENVSRIQLLPRHFSLEWTAMEDGYPLSFLSILWRSLDLYFVQSIFFIKYIFFHKDLFKNKKSILGSPSPLSTSASKESCSPLYNTKKSYYTNTNYQGSEIVILTNF